jgi:hypothetical protein
VPILKNGLKRIVNHYVGASLAPRVSAPSVFQSLNLPSSPRLSPRLRDSASKNEPASEIDPASKIEPASNRSPR